MQIFGLEFRIRDRESNESERIQPNSFGILWWKNFLFLKKKLFVINDQ